MNTLTLAVLACVAALAMADSYGYNGLRRSYGGLKAPFNNAARQEAVNEEAEEAGAGTGTASEEGVPGTGLKFGYKYEPYYGRGYAGHGYAAPRAFGYGYPAFGGAYGGFGHGFAAPFGYGY